MKITKMHGLGNDFILIDNRDGSVSGENALAKKLCERRLSIGADGLMTVEKSNIADIRMRIFNSDGSEAEMCGNGIRCFARFVYDAGMVSGSEFTVETLAGIMKPEMIFDEKGSITGVRVDMGSPLFDADSIPMLCDDPLNAKVTAAGKDITLHTCLMTIPHTVVIVDGESVMDEDFDALGPAIEKHDIFPKNSNVNFAKLIDRSNIAVRTWERGAGPTLACGTGSCATVCVLAEMGLLERDSYVHLYAGKLHVEYGSRVYMTGPAEYVFKGELI